LRVSELGLGCARIGGIFKNDPKEFIRLLSAAHDRGITFFDTADMYSQGESEMLLGRAFQRRRAQVAIASKVGYCLPTQRRMIARVKPIVRPLIRLLRIKRASLPSAVRGSIEQNFSPGYIRSAVEGSLRRLRTDYLDLLQLHSPTAEVVERGEWARAIEDLRRAGKVRHFGISCDTLEAAHAALAVDGVASLQLVVNLLDQSFAQAILPQAHRKGVAVIARECLANGLLVKPEPEIDLKTYCQSPEQEERRKIELAVHRAAAEARGIPLAKLALEYVTGVEGVSVALVGASRLDQLTHTLRDFGV
jgi:aryl-alcohol dehydrogenase-like predicted oxidoreductase